MPFMEVEPGVRLYYEDYGEGKPFVFVHGGGQSHDMWEQQVYALTDHYRTITYDLRAHGESDKPAAGRTVERFTADLEAMIDGLRLADVTLVCHGMGAYFGVYLTAKRPDAVKRLVLVGTGARFSGADEERGGFSTEVWDRHTTDTIANKARRHGSSSPPPSFMKTRGTQPNRPY